MQILVSQLFEELGEIPSHLGQETVERLRRLLTDGDEKGLQSCVQELVAPLFDGDAERFGRLVQARKCLEEIIADKIVDVSTVDISRAIMQVGDSMSELADKSDPQERDFSEYWNLDGEFHATLGRIAGLPNTEEFVRALQAAVVGIGTPRDRDELRLTHKEHLQIIDALRSADKKEIKSSMMEHAEASCRRWLERARIAIDEWSRSMDGILPQLPNLKQYVTEKFGPSLTSEEEHTFIWSTFLQRSYPNEYVAWIQKAPLLSSVVLVHASDWDAFYEQTRDLSAADRENVRVHHMTVD